MVFLLHGSHAATVPQSHDRAAPALASIRDMGSDRSEPNPSASALPNTRTEDEKRVHAQDQGDRKYAHATLAEVRKTLGIDMRNGTPSNYYYTPTRAGHETAA